MSVQFLAGHNNLLLKNVQFSRELTKFYIHRFCLQNGDIIRDSDSSIFLFDLPHNLNLLKTNGHHFFLFIFRGFFFFFSKISFLTNWLCLLATSRHTHHHLMSQKKKEGFESGQERKKENRLGRWYHLKKQKKKLIQSLSEFTYEQSYLQETCSCKKIPIHWPCIIKSK